MSTTMISENENVWDGERLETKIYDEYTVEHLHRYAVAAELIQGKNVLDLASGEGYGSNLMAKFANSVIGVDISEEAISHARKKYKKENLKFLQGSAAKVPIESSSIDVVVSFETIEHHDMHEEMMMEIKRVLKSDGLLVMSSPDKLNYSDIPGQNNPYHIKELYFEEFKELIEKYFKNNIFLLQKLVYGSLIIPDSHYTDFTGYSGSYDFIESFRNIKDPVYDICIASEAQLDMFGASFFDGKKAFDRLLTCREIQTEALIKSTFSYKIGRGFTYPLRFLRDAFVSSKLSK